MEVTVSQFKITRTYTVIERTSGGYICESDDGKCEFFSEEEIQIITKFNPKFRLDS